MMRRCWGKLSPHWGRISPDSRKRIFQTVGTFFQFEASVSAEASASADLRVSRSAPGAGNIQSTPSTFSGDRTPSPKQFLSEKQPRTDVERVACLAFYLTHYRDTPNSRPSISARSTLRRHNGSSQMQQWLSTMLRNTATWFRPARARSKSAPLEKNMYKRFLTTTPQRPCWPPPGPDGNRGRATQSRDSALEIC